MATHIIPGARYEPFRGHFVITPIHNAVLINGEALPVAENLANALEYLRMLQGPHDLRIWIDQICIDQGDVIERGRQVAMMRLIYSKAECVRIWIDAPGLKDTSEVVKPLKTFQFQDSESNFGLGNDLHVWVPLRGMFHSGYWKRLWMEVAVNLGRDES
ncbi:hypothetical protein HBI12_214200 [Parastagonospora nodorum]|nr:hypothetical protein HBI12_214200 [Parastagonospora nodorum]KAH5397932.1 hypothetical protein HBI47_209870 [Parastagonospora nodorum]